MVEDLVAHFFKAHFSLRNQVFFLKSFLIFNLLLLIVLFCEYHYNKNAFSAGFGSLNFACTIYFSAGKVSLRYFELYPLLLHLNPLYPIFGLVYLTQMITQLNNYLQLLAQK